MDRRMHSVWRGENMKDAKTKPWPFQKFVAREVSFACQRQDGESPDKCGVTTVQKIKDLMCARIDTEIVNLASLGFIQLTKDGRIRIKKKTPYGVQTKTGFFGYNVGGRAHRPTKYKKILHIAKIAPCTARSYPVGGGWRFYSGHVLLQEARRPLYLADKHEDFLCSADAQWSSVQAPFEFVDLQIALHTVKNNLSCPSEMLGDGISFARLSKRFDRFVGAELMQVDKSITINHVGNYRPRWYRPTDKLIEIVAGIKAEFPECLVAPQYLPEQIDFEDL